MKRFNYQTPFYYANLDKSILLTIDEHKAYHELLKENNHIKKYSTAVYCHDVKFYRVFFNTQITTNQAFYLGKCIEAYLNNTN